MFKSYKYRLLPTEDQKAQLNGLFGACRFVFNLALEVKIRAWESGRVNISAYDLMKQLTELRNTECAWLKKLPLRPLQASIANLDTAYKKFFKGGGFPNYKKRDGRQSARFVKEVRLVDNNVLIPKIGAINFIEHRPLPNGELRTVTLSKLPSGTYFVSILLNDNIGIPPKKKIEEESAVGIDLGLKSFAILSDNTVFGNPRYLKEQLKRLRVEQRKLQRRFKKGAKEQSKGYQKQKLAVAKLHEKVANKRKDFLHKTSTAITKQYDTICIETLNVSGLQKNGNLSKAISDVSWSEFSRMLQYKSEWSGKNLVKIGRFQPSSKMCSKCGLVNNSLSLSDRTWDCNGCGEHLDRDLNAAINIKNFGLEAKPSTAKVSQKTELIGCE